MAVPTQTASPILAVDDDRGLLLSIKAALVSTGLPEPALLSDGSRVMDCIRDNQSQVVLLDIVMPTVNGMDLLRDIKQEFPDIECVMITAMDDVSLAVQAIKFGAYDYLVKPVDRDKLSVVIKRAMEKYHLRHGLSLYERGQSFSDLKNPDCFRDMIARDEAMARVFHQVEMVAPTDYNLVITGESGTGKEMLARIIHNVSPRRDQPFIAVNMAAFSASLFEEEFFGHKRGAYTGAVSDKRGFFEAAHGGTLFLDEITELDISLQGKLLRVIQEGTIYRVGSTDTRTVNVRLISATNRNIPEEINRGAFRPDLFYRLNMFHITIPPLRERRNDVLPLARHFLDKHAQKTGKKIDGWKPELEEYFMAYDFPGNVRELENMIAQAVLFETDDTLHTSSVSHAAFSPDHSHNTAQSLKLDDVEKQHIMQVLKHTGYNRTRAAKMLGIGLRTLQRKLKEMDYHDNAPK